MQQTSQVESNIANINKRASMEEKENGVTEMIEAFMANGKQN
jgi:hypothetical protein